MGYRFDESVERAMTRLGFYPPDVYKEIMSIEAPVRSAKVTEVLDGFRREQKFQLALNHPDKGGTAERFRDIRESFQKVEAFLQGLREQLEEKYSKKEMKTVTVYITG